MILITPRKRILFFDQTKNTKQRQEKEKGQMGFW